MDAEPGSATGNPFTEFSIGETSFRGRGYAERLGHVELIRSGAPSYMVMCQARDVHANPREVASFDRNDVFVGGRLVDIEGDYWLERSARRPASSIRLKAQS